MSLLGEGAAHPMHHWRRPRRPSPFSFFLTAERWPKGRSSLEPCVRERERERGGAMRRRGERDHGHD